MSAEIEIRTGRDEVATVAVGDFLSESLVTDTIVYEVVKTTAKTIGLRRTAAGGQITEDPHCDKGAYGLSVVWEERVPAPEAAVKTYRVRKDGTIRAGDWAGARPFYPTPTIDGKPVSRRDWRF